MRFGIFILILSISLYGQATDGNIVGTVSDKSGAVIAGATVEATNTATNVRLSTQTAQNGDYRFNNVPVGRYTINFSASGFTASSITNFAVELNKTSTANAALEVSSVSTSVEVTEAAATINTTNAQLQSSYDSRQTLELGMSSNIGGGGNNYGVLNLSLLSAGVASSGGVGYGAGPSVGGQRPTNNNFVIEGIDNNRRDITGPIAYVSNEAVSEFTLLQNNVAPEFGHNSGGTFNTVVKSGGNTVHGSLYDYMQNRNLNALDAAFKRQGISERQRYDQNRVGGTIGGPIIREKLFYFGNFEYNPLGEAGTPSSATLAPTAQGYSMLDAMPSSVISRTNLDILKQYLAPAATGTQTTTVNGMAIPIGVLPIIAPSYSNIYSYLGSLDYNMSTKDQFRGRFVGGNTRAINNNPNLPTFFSNQPTNTYLASGTWFHNFTPNTLNEFRAAYTRFYQQVPVGSFNFPGLDVFPNIQIQQDLNMQLGPDPNGPQGTIINSYQLADNFNWTKGRHTIKAGYDGRRIIAPQSFVQRSRGDYNYNTLDTYLRDLTPDVLAERSFGVSDFWGNLWSHYAYLNDDFRMTRNLTLNLGVRYEYVGNPAAASLQALNSAASVPGLIDFRAPTAEKNNWAPRVGLAWSPGRSGSTVIRAGFGMSYDQLYQNLGILSLPPQFITTVNETPDTFPGVGFLRNGGIRNPGGGASLTPAEARELTASYIPDQRRPYSINWTFGVQQVIARDYTLEVRYLGTRGVRLPAQIRLNRGTVITPTNSLPTYMSSPSQAQLDALPLTLDMLTAQVDPLHQRYLDAGFQQNVVGFMPWNNSTYHGLAMQLTKRFSNHLQFVTSYTWSHLIDDGTATVFSTLIAPRRAEDFTNLSREKSSSALDRRHRWTFSWIYETPWLSGSQNWFAKNIIGNWSFTGTYTAESPMYGTVQSSTDANLNGDAAGDRAIINPAGTNGVGSGVTPLTNSAGQTVAYLADNPNARYISAGRGAYTNAGRMTIPLRGINNFDMSFLKRFNITESKKLEFRAEMFNAFNTSQYTPGATNTIRPVDRVDTNNYLIPGDETFFKPETAYSNNPRVIQLVARFVF
jgi:hypothetical protein